LLLSSGKGGAALQWGGADLPVSRGGRGNQFQKKRLHLRERKNYTFTGGEIPVGVDAISRRRGGGDNRILS